MILRWRGKENVELRVRPHSGAPGLPRHPDAEAKTRGGDREGLEAGAGEGDLSCEL